MDNVFAGAATGAGGLLWKVGRARRRWLSVGLILLRLASESLSGRLAHPPAHRIAVPELGFDGVDHLWGQVDINSLGCVRLTVHQHLSC
jgi:hypothetical protein